MGDLRDQPYLSLATFRRSGKAVETAVWFAAADTKLYVFTAGDSGKVKRLRNSPRSRVAPCDVRGRVLGDWTDARTHIVEDPTSVETAYAALRAKYGLQMHITDLLSRLTGRYAKRAILEIQVTD